MRNFLYAILVLTVLAIFSALYLRAKKEATPAAVRQPATENQNPAPVQSNSSTPTETALPGPAISVKNASGFGPPLSNASRRVTKKKFGVYITPQNSPVQPERFRGYHTGTDFEIIPGEENADVPVVAVCGGKLVLKKSASGYGGVAVESCQLDGNPITVVYGHLKLSSVAAGVGDNLSAGDTVGILGKGYSSETDGERKHLHLGFHKGSNIDIRGYVQNQAELSNWFDPCKAICND